MSRARQVAGARGRTRGAAWEADIRAGLERWTAAGHLLDWQQQGPLVQRVGPGGRRVIVIEEEGPVDFLAWSRDREWMFEAKATTALRRWPYAKLEPHQARRLIRWHSPDRGRVAGVALRYDLAERGRVDLWLAWDVLAPLWSRWAVGEAARGGASLTLDEAQHLGRVWGAGVWA